MATFASALAVLLLAAPARADDKDMCADSYEKGQRLQRAGSLRASREQFLVCARDPCASFVKADCTKWLADIDAAMPSVTFVVKRCDSKGCTDVPAPKLTVDGKPIEATGRAVPIDPGKHQAHAEEPGYRSDDFVFVTHEGEQGKLVELRLVPPPPPEPTTTRRYMPRSVILPASVAAVGLGSFGIFSILGRTQQSNELEDCRGHCSGDAVDSVRTKYIIADISLGISVIALAAATYLWLSTPRVTSKEVEQ